MNEYLSIVVDIVAITILVFGIYFPRHRRTDMALAYMTVNIGVLAVADTLAASAVAAGLGLGLFGVLSIIRLRSEELTQREVAYYFAALAIGLIAGLAEVTPKQIGLVALILLIIAIVDSRHLYPVQRRLMVLDRAIADEGELRDYVASLCSGQIIDIAVEEIDLVKDSTTVRVQLKESSDRNSKIGVVA